jgi:hypothetical protein
MDEPVDLDELTGYSMLSNYRNMVIISCSMTSVDSARLPSTCKQ